MKYKVFGDIIYIFIKEPYMCLKYICASNNNVYVNDATF